MSRVDTIRSSVESQIADLQGQLHSLKGTLAERGSDVYDSADEQARHALRRVRREARAMGSAARENPATTTALLSVVALTCIGIGYLAGRSSSDHRW